MLSVVVGATLALLDQATAAQSRDQAYGTEIRDAQTAMGRLIHDLRQASSFQSITPNTIQFQMVANGTTYNVKYDCTASDTLASPYTRCARTQAVAPGSPPAPSAITPGSPGVALDIQHVHNNANTGFTTFCNSAGTGPSGSVFFISNPNIPNTDGSSAACDEAYEQEIAGLNPTYVQVRVQVPASGSLVRGGLNHYTVLETGTFLPILDAGA